MNPLVMSTMLGWQEYEKYVQEHGANEEPELEVICRNSLHGHIAPPVPFHPSEILDEELLNLFDSE